MKRKNPCGTSTKKHIFKAVTGSHSLSSNAKNDGKSVNPPLGPGMILTNGTEFSSHFGWNGKRGIHLSISIFPGNVPVEWPEPFELPTENSGFCCQMVNCHGVEMLL